MDQLDRRIDRSDRRGGRVLRWKTTDGPQATAAEATTVTQTITATRTLTSTVQPSSEPGDPPRTNSSDGPVAWSGDIAWGLYNLDFNPPKQVPGKSIRAGHGRLTAYTSDTATLADWQSDSVPNKSNCAAALADHGSAATEILVNDRYVCGRTAEGRMFRIHVIAAGSAEISSSVTVWEK